MLPKSQRLNLERDFKRAASGRKLETNLLKLFVKFGDNSLPKIGIAVSSKYFKKATERNRARRLLSQAFQSIYCKLPTTINIVALPKQRILEVKSAEVLEDLERILKDEKIVDQPN